MSNNHKTIVVGAGMSGLTAAAYLSKEGHDVLLIEKYDSCGGLLSSFERDGFTFDGGARSIENSGIIRPMLKQLGIELELLQSPVSIGIEDTVISYLSNDNLYDYQKMLEDLYPESHDDIKTIIKFTKKILKDMAVLYGIDNPIFVDLKNNKKFLFTQIMPWAVKFLFTIFRMSRFQGPVEDFLSSKTVNQSLIDIIAQHFFKRTPTFFAMGYFYIYLDYLYPRGGTGELPKSIGEKILEFGGKIQYNTRIVEVDPSEKKILDSNGTSYYYENLVWCTDLKSLYRMLDLKNVNEEVSREINDKKEELMATRGSDSVFSVFLAVDEPLETFRKISNGHFFYTPSRKGLGEVHTKELQAILDDFENTPKEIIYEWLDRFCAYNTYEISIPALRDPSLTPEGKTGMEFSTLFEYDLVKKVLDAGWYDEFKIEVEKRIIETIADSIYPMIKDKIIFKFSSSPLTISTISGSSEGAIVGWSFEYPIPVVNQFLKIAQSVKTSIPNVWKAGQWAYSPAGIPTAILTGMLAAQDILKK